MSACTIQEVAHHRQEDGPSGRAIALARNDSHYRARALPPPAIEKPSHRLPTGIGGLSVKVEFGHSRGTVQRVNGLGRLRLRKPPPTQGASSSGKSFLPSQCITCVAWFAAKTRQGCQRAVCQYLNQPPEQHGELIVRHQLPDERQVFGPDRQLGPVVQTGHADERSAAPSTNHQRAA